MQTMIYVEWSARSEALEPTCNKLANINGKKTVTAEKRHIYMVFNLQVPGSINYNMVFYFVTMELIPGSLMQRFVGGDDEFYNSRTKLIPSVRKEFWIVRQSVGSTPSLLGKAVDYNYIRGASYLEVNVLSLFV